MSTISSIVGQKYAFAYGRSAHLQAALLNQSDLNRMLGSSDGKDAVRMLTELPITNFINQGIQEPTKIFQAIVQWIQAEITTMVPKKSQIIFDAIWLPATLAELALLLKKKHGFLQSEQSIEQLFLPAARSNMLKVAIESGNITALPIAEQWLLRDLPKQFSSPVEIDTLLAQKSGALRKKLAKQSGSKLIVRYIEHVIDIHNIQAKLRLNALFTAEHFITGGTLPLSAFLKDTKTMYQAINQSNLAYTLAANLQDATNQIEIEQACNAVLQADLADMWTAPLTVEPIFAFAAIGVHNVKLLRAIIIAKQNGLSPQETKQILPPFIPATAFAS